MNRPHVAGRYLTALTRRIAYAAVCVAALVSLSGCGSPPAAAESPQEVRVDAQTLFERWYGTNAQRRAAEVLVAYALNGPTAACMKDHGYRWDWSIATQGAPPVDALRSGFWLAEPKALVRSHALLAADGSRRAEVTMNSDQTNLSPAGERALTRCLNSVTGASDHDVQVLHKPPSTQKLMGEWVKVLTSVTKRFGSTRDYERCMTRAQLSLLAGKPYGDETIGRAFAEATPPVSKVPRRGEQPTPEWTRFMALDREVATADWDCRKGTYDEGMTEVAPLLEEFESTHQAQIEASERTWRDVEKQAVRLGWDAATGQVTAAD